MSCPRNLIFILPCLSLLPLSACIDRSVTSVEPVPSKEERTDFPYSQNRDLDILFVIDNSRSMLAEQTSLAINFTRIADALEGLETGLPNVHIGVVSTDVGAGGHTCGAGDNGRLQAAARVPGCTPPTGQFISNVEGVPNYSGSLSDAFSCIAQLGRDGCGFEQPLEAMRRALDGSNPENAGFLRDSARLAVIFISDEDDCSAFDGGMFARTGEPGEDLGAQKSFRCFEHGVMCDDDTDPRVPGTRASCEPRTDSEYMHDVSDYVAFLKGLKSFEEDILVAGIVGKAGPIEVTTDAQGDPCLMYSCGDVTVCAGAEEQPAAVPPVRLQAFMDAFSRKTTTTICDEDLSGSVQQIADFFPDFVGGQCILNPLRDMEPETPGLQPECVVSEIRAPNTPQQQETIIATCDAQRSSLPCYELVEDPEACSRAQHLSVEVFYADNESVPSSTRINARCLGE